MSAPTSLFLAPNGLNELLEVRFEFPFNLIGKFTMAFFQQANPRAYSNPGTQMGAQSKDLKGLKGTQLADAHVLLISFLN